MLISLKIKNVAVVEDAFIEFSDGLNIISGETGAGKSVVLDALSLTLGAKADKTLIKNGKDFLKVEATFSFDNNMKIAKILEDMGLDYEECLIISRKISVDGKNETKINNNLVPVSYLKNLSNYILDIHTQNENLILLNKNKQLELIDNFAKIDKTKISTLYDNLIQINERILELDKDVDLRERELELLNFQIDEIEKAKLVDGEEEELKNELILLKNSEKINNSLKNVKDLFENDNINISNLLKKLGFELNNLNNLNFCEDIINRFDSVNIELNDIYDEILEKYNYTFDEERFAFIDERLDLYKKIYRKYGSDYLEVKKYLDDAKVKRDYLLNFQENLDKLLKQKKEILILAFKECKDIEIKRKKISEFLENAVIEELKELSMQNAKLKIKINNFTEEDFESKFSSNGANSVEFLFSANMGEEIRPLNQVVSGGELSRLMLALKTITCNTDEIPTIIFDELDTGISGEASISTAKKLAKISKTHQIIAISHLLQICSMADRNMLVKKLEENGKTTSTVNVLKPEETVLELCRFMSVDGITDSTLKHAQEIKEYCDKYKISINNNC